MGLNKNKNKKELLNSGLSLALCGVLFAGATLAYFTKSVFSNDNIIKTSKLDVAFKYKDNNGDWKDVNGSIFNDVDKISANEKIEKEIQIINTGDLPFEYDIDIFRELEVNSLLESNISVKIERVEGETKKEEYNGALNTTLAAGNTELEGKSLLNKDDSHEYKITIAMANTDKPLNADDYSNKTIEAFDIQVRATQIEEDKKETPALQGIGYFYRSTSTGNIHVSVVTGVELDLSKNSEDDIKIEYLKADGSVLSLATKNKTFYDEYLNKDGVKYPSSSNTILPVGEYSTTFSGNVFVKTKDVAGIRITVTNDGVSETITQYLR